LKVSNVVAFHDNLLEAVALGASLSFDFVEEPKDLSVSELSDFQVHEPKPELVFSAVAETHEPVALPDLEVSEICHHESDATPILAVSHPTEIEEGEKPKEAVHIEHSGLFEATPREVVLRVSASVSAPPPRAYADISSHHPTRSRAIDRELRGIPIDRDFSLDG
jgi:hypothetical protein